MATTKVSGELVDLNEATSESGLKMPTGTNNNRPTAVAGQIRDNTNETSEGSASCMEYYKSGAWQKINNVALPVYRSTVLYTGNSTNDFSTSLEQSITGVGFKPDLVWIKQRNDNYSNGWFDSSRGATNQLQSNNDSAQSTSAGYLKSFDTDGFGLGGDFAFNRNTYTYAAWCWKLNGGTTSSNGEGDITSTVQVNAAAGISITTYQNNGSNSARVGHGLGTTPKIVLIKKYSVSGAWHFMTTQIDGSFDDLILNTDAVKSDSALTAPTSTTFAAESGGSGEDMICFAFAEISGYSKFGTYTGNGSTQSITGLGFQPGWVLIKSATQVANWLLFDSARGATKALSPNDNAAEVTNANMLTSFDSDGFSLGNQTSVNANTETYIYMAFK